MSAPASIHDLVEIASRLQRLQNELASTAAEIVYIFESNAVHRTAYDGEQGLGEVLTLTQAAKLMGRSRSWTHEQVRSGVIPAIRLGTRWWVRKRALERWLQGDQDVVGGCHE